MVKGSFVNIDSRYFKPQQQENYCLLKFAFAQCGGG